MSVKSNESNSHNQSLISSSDFQEYNVSKDSIKDNANFKLYLCNIQDTIPILSIYFSFLSFKYYAIITFIIKISIFSIIAHIPPICNSEKMI